MKIVINKCFGGFSLSPLAVKRLAQLQGRECYFYTRGDDIDDFKLISKLKQVERKLDREKEIEDNMDLSMFDIPNFNELYKEAKAKDKAGLHNKSNALYEKHVLDTRPDDRTDPKLIQVVEELGEKADGSCAKLRIIEIPDGVEYEIDEYDGQESVHEKHRSWG